MLNKIKQSVIKAPTAMAGLALGISSLTLLWNSITNLNGSVQIVGAIIASGLLFILLLKFIIFPQTLKNDLAHPTIGSVVPTFAMASMVISKCIAQHCSLLLGEALWILAVCLHLAFLTSFTYHRARNFKLHHMTPSWFVPPVGIIVAAVVVPSAPLIPLAQVLLIFGMISYAIILPIMIYRFIFSEEIIESAKPTIAILAAPASLSLAGYLTVINHPSPIIIAILLGIALLMTAIIYLAFIRLLRLPFSPGYAAFTFPMVIGATALFKTAHLMKTLGIPKDYISQIHNLAFIEIIIATIIVSYVSMKYLSLIEFKRNTKTIGEIA